MFGLFTTQCLHWIDLGRLPSWDIARDYGCPDHERSGDTNGNWVYGWQAIELRGNKTLSGENSGNPDRRVRSEPKGKSQDGYAGNDRVLQQLAEGEAKIVHGQ